ncbi:protein phosphatase 1 regulatory subunit sds22-related [Anaeramoeba flamelloides]|uniref:Protein phosphatase 1 regulatory subunit sds22-related n=1 Tax=Anaeramoeba flamelloides TaxID=1746091 RepID=A0AAV7YRK0_9EUKA|nr:protein phosphatase 1 regulatory subunit sds22-related [Anaeramoeba flamelloides]
MSRQGFTSAINDFLLVDRTQTIRKKKKKKETKPENNELTFEKNKNSLDYSDKQYSTKIPFSFPIKDINSDLILPNVVAVLPDFIQQLVDPPSGPFLEGFDRDKYQKERKKPFINFVPHIFSRKISPLRFPNQIPNSQQIRNPNLLKKASTHKTAMIAFSNLKLTTKQRSVLVYRISKFKLIEILILKNCGINDVSKFSFPRLRICNMSGNKLRKIKPLILFLKRCPALEILDFSKTPIAKRKLLRPLILANCPRITFINNKEVEIQERIQAIETHGNKKMIKQVGKIRWDLTMCSISEIRTMPRWNPQNVVNLILPKLNLTEFHVGSLRSLQLLDLGHNKIRKLEGTGLERCGKLLELNLHNNRIESISQVLNVVPYCPSLQRLDIENNDNLIDYRLKVIYTCRYLRGTNRQPGLTTLDGAPVDMVEYILSLQRIGKQSKKTIESKKWILSQINYFGHYQITKIPGFLKKVTIGNFSNRELKTVNVKSYRNLVVLKLRNNNLKTVEGLNRLKALQLLDLSKNKHLNLDNILNQLVKLKTLLSVSFANDLEISKKGRLLNKNTNTNENSNDNNSNESSKTKTEKLTVFNSGYRIKVISKLFINNIYLNAIDLRPIEYHERCEGVKKISEETEILTGMQVEKYKFHLAVQTCNIPVEHRMTHYTQVKPGNHYDPMQIKKLINLKGLNLTERGLNFSIFQNLEELNLSNNKITDLFKLGLENLKNLKIVDLSYNQINNKIDRIASWIDQMHSLEVLCLRGNPCLKDKTNRRLLIGSIKSMREITSRLRVLDTEITISERVEGWKAQGATEEQCNDLRFKATLYIRLPKDLLSKPMRVKKLNLSNAELSQIDISEFKNLKRLNLQNNKIKSIHDIIGIEKLTQLKVLDLRKNLISDESSVVELVKQLPNLVSIGLNKNQFNIQSQKKKKNKNQKMKLIYRQDFLNLLTFLINPVVPLKQLDGDSITLEELSIVIKRQLSDKEWKKFDFEKYKFQINLNRRLPVNKKKEKFKEINLENCQLTTIQLSPYINLVKLSLRNNTLTDKNISADDFKSLKKLIGLDFRDNKIKKLQTFSEIVNALPKLKYFFIEGNPCYTSDKEQNRIKFISSTESIMKPGSKLEYFNGKPIELKTVCNAITTLRKQKKKNIAKLSLELEDTRLSLIIEKLEIDPNIKSIKLRNFDLQIIQRVSIFSNIIELNLSNNSITTLEGQGLENLNKLRSLNICNNEITSYSNLINSLVEFRFVKYLYIQNATATSELQNPNSYYADVCKILRGLSHVDNKSNPNPLESQHLEVLQELEKITNGVAGNPHKITEMDLSGNDFPKELFDPVIRLLAQLPVTDLRMNNNPWDQTPNYRYLVIFQIPSLQSLDGIVLSMAQRDNALQFVEKNLKGQKDLTGLGVVAGGVAIAHSGVDGTRLDASDQPMVIKAGKKAKDVIDENSLDINYADFKGEVMIVQSNRKNDAYKMFAPVGTYITKFEIIVTFFQILGLLVSLIDPVYWPDIFLNLSWITFPFAIDIDFLIIVFDIEIPISYQYFKFIIFMILPALMFFMYYIRFNREKWKKIYIANWKKTKIWILAAWIVGMALSGLLGFLVGINGYQENGNSLTTTQRSLIIVLMLLYCLFILLFYLNARFFRKHQTDRYWFRYNKYKKRIALFLFTVLYMPLTRVILYNFKCDSEGETLILFPDEKCIMNGGSFMVIHGFSILFGIIYIIGIPLFFVWLIKFRVNEIIGFYQMESKIINVKQMKKESKTPQEKRIAKKESKKLKEEYKRRVKEFKCPESYLYNAHTKEFKYYKPFQMAEKFIYLILTIFYGAGNVLGLVAAIAITFFCVIALLFRPFSDFVEDLLDDIGKIVNMLCILIGTLLAYSAAGLSQANTGPILVILNVFFLLAVLFAFVINPFRKRRAKMKAKRYLKQQDQDQDIELDDLNSKKKQQVINDDDFIDDDDFNDLMDLDDNFKNNPLNDDQNGNKGNIEFQDPFSNKSKHRNEGYSFAERHFDDLNFEGVDLEELENLSDLTDSSSEDDDDDDDGEEQIALNSEDDDEDDIILENVKDIDDEETKIMIPKGVKENLSYTTLKKNFGLQTIRNIKVGDDLKFHKNNKRKKSRKKSKKKNKKLILNSSSDIQPEEDELKKKKKKH